MNIINKKPVLKLVDVLKASNTFLEEIPQIGFLKIYQIKITKDKKPS